MWFVDRYGARRGSKGREKPAKEKLEAIVRARKRDDMYLNKKWWRWG